MRKSILLGTILGGITAFVWSMISWELIGWHEKTMSAFRNEDEVAAVIASQADADGTYGLPAAWAASDQKTRQAMLKKMESGVIMVAAVRRHGFGSIARATIAQVLILLASALLVTWLLMQTSGLGYARKVMFVAVVGLTASAMCDLPNWNWWGFSGAYTAVNLIDSTVTWLLAGLVIAKVAKK